MIKELIIINCQLSIVNSHEPRSVDRLRGFSGRRLHPVAGPTSPAAGLRRRRPRHRPQPPHPATAKTAFAPIARRLPLRRLIFPGDRGLLPPGRPPPDRPI